MGLCKETKDEIILTERGSFYIHLLQNYFILNYINKVWTIAKRDVALAPTLPCAGNGKELPKDSFTIFEKLVIIIVSRKNALYYILYTIMLYN
ncbi:MAG: hypothetical protein V1905_02225, partial [bacterium]